MAIVVPYGDAQAHGTIGKTLTFRRYRGTVVLQKKPHPVQPNTPAQIARRDKFVAAWVAFHALTSWELEYLEKKAVQYNMTAANLFLRQYLLDEIPSKVPMNLIREVTDLSIPVPVSPELQGLKIEIIAIEDEGPVLNTFARIYDYENIYTHIQTVETYTRAIIRLSVPDPVDIVMPMDYSLLTNWLTHGDIAFLDIIKFPYINIGQTFAPSTTPRTNLHDITALVIDDVIGAELDDLLFEFKVKKEDPGPDVLIAGIQDNENILDPAATDTPQEGAYLKITRLRGPSMIISDNYSFALTWTPPGGPPEEIVLELPRLDIGNSGDPSTTVHNQIKKATDAGLFFTVGLGLGDYSIALLAWPDPPGYGELIVSIFDNGNIPNIFPPQPPYARVSIRIINWTTSPWTVPADYGLWIEWEDYDGVSRLQQIKVPQDTIPADDFVEYWLSDDFCLYEEKELTTLVVDNTVEPLILWFADDWASYYNEALTELAKAHFPPPIDLYLADDFSLYWDKEMKHLASTPFY